MKKKITMTKEDGDQEAGSNNGNETTIRQMIDFLAFSYKEIGLAQLPTKCDGKENNHESMYSGPDGLKESVASNFSNPCRQLQDLQGPRTSTSNQPFFQAEDITTLKSWRALPWMRW